MGLPAAAADTPDAVSRRVRTARSTVCTVTQAHRGVGASKEPDSEPLQPVVPQHIAMNWTRSLKQVFGIEIEGCARCGGKQRFLASIEEPAPIARILSHREHEAVDRNQMGLPLDARAPPL